MSAIAHDHRVDPATHVAGDQAERHSPATMANSTASAADEERDAHAVEDGGKDVPPLAVGAEQEAVARERVRLHPAA